MRFSAFLIRYRWLVLGALTVVTLGAASLLRHIHFDFTPEGALRGDDDLVSYSHAFKDTFGHSDGILLVVLESIGPGDALSAPALTWQGQVCRRIAATPGIERLEAVSTLQIPGTLAETVQMIPVKPLVTELPVDAAAEARIRKAVDDLKLIDGSLISSDRRVSSIVAHIKPESLGINDLRTIVGAVANVLREVPPPPGYATHISGLPAMRAGIVGGLHRDLLTLFPAAGVLFLVVLGLEFRRISGAILPMLAVGVGLVWTGALIVLRGESFNIISNILPFLLFVIGIANCVHMITRYAEESGRLGPDALEAARRTIAHMSVACFLTFLTTAIGFSALLGARSGQLRSLGWHAMAGMCFLYVTTIAVLGALLPSIRTPRHMRAESGHIHPVARLLGFAGHAVARRPRTMLACSLAVIAVFGWFAHTVVASSWLFETYDADHPQMQALGLVEEKLGGVVPLEISLTADIGGKFLEPDTYRRVAEAQRFAEGLEIVVSARSYVDLHNEVRGRMVVRAGFLGKMLDPVSDDRARLRTQDRILRNIPSLCRYDEFLTADGRWARIMLTVRDVGSRRMLGVLDVLNAKLAELFPAESGVKARLTGTAQVHARAMDRFVRDMVTSLLGAALVIFVVIGLLFRSLRIGLIAVLPNITPLVITWGYIGMRGYQMNAANVIVFAISLGIAVDNTIHFLARFREEVKTDGNAPEAIRRSYHGTGRAIVLTSVLIVTGLSVLMLSEFVPSRRFAELANVTVAGALLGDLFLLPACLMLFWKPPRRSQSQ